MTNVDKIQGQKISAITLTVSDGDRLRDFYEQTLGFNCISDIMLKDAHSNLPGIAKAKIRLLTLQLGDEQIKLMDYLNYQSKPLPKDSKSNDLWFQHLAIVVSDMDRAYAHLKSCSVDSISPEPQTIPLSNKASGGVRSFKFKDPDGHNLELIWFPPDKGKQKWHQNHNNERLFLGIDHSAITVSNTKQSLQFYQDLLGFKIKENSLNSGETQARLDGLSQAEVKVTSLSPTQGGIGIELLDYLVPSDGRPKPENWTSGDLGHLQIELVINNFDQLQNKGIQLTSSPFVDVKGSVISYQYACLGQDPDGHPLLFTTQ